MKLLHLYTGRKVGKPLRIATDMMTFKTNIDHVEQFNYAS